MNAQLNSLIVESDPNSLVSSRETLNEISGELMFVWNSLSLLAEKLQDSDDSPLLDKLVSTVWVETEKLAKVMSHLNSLENERVKSA